MQRLTNKQVFIRNSTYARHHIKRRIIEEKLLPYICSECGNTGHHNGKELVLQLDHKNGLAEDNRLSNLHFLCPNCHSQTPTYAGRASTGKRNKKVRKPSTFFADKLAADHQLLQDIISEKSDIIQFGTWGWKGRLCKEIGITGQKVTPWLRRVDPDFLEQVETGSVV